jgi:hypothetical protein
MYTWGDLKEITFAKLDLTYDSENSIENDLLDRIPYYANEAMTQICSAIKPCVEYKEFEIDEPNTIENLSKIDNDFISFSDNINYYKPLNKNYSVLSAYDSKVNEEFNKRYGNYSSDFVEASDDDFVYYGYGSLLFKKPGIYKIAYNKRWVDFTTLKDDDVLSVPNDILDAIPSYIASQCYKVDDEVKSSIYRNEFEMAIARIDNTDWSTSKTLKIGGDWW